MDFYIPEDDILHSHCRENLKSNSAFIRDFCIFISQALIQTFNVIQTHLLQITILGRTHFSTFQTSQRSQHLEYSTVWPVCEYGGDTFLRNVGLHTGHMVLYPTSWER
jgi:hypothetical protein